MFGTVAVPLLVVVLTLAGGWLVSTRVSDHWDQVKRRREADLAAAEEFQRLYGEFFAAWKSWNAISQRSIEINDSSAAAWESLKRAAEIEGRAEALFAKVAAERDLSDGDIAVLGAVRQGLQTLRGAIKRGEPLPWWGSEVEQYGALKYLAVYATGLLGASSKSEHVPTSRAAENFRRITSNEHERSWLQTAAKLRSTGASPGS